MAYNGYANQKEASEKKIIRNLFEPNQDAFNTGKHKWKKNSYFYSVSCGLLAAPVPVGTDRHRATGIV